MQRHFHNWVQKNCAWSKKLQLEQQQQQQRRTNAWTIHIDLSYLWDDFAIISLT